MQIILMQEVPKLGAAGQMVTVKDGYARNYLIPLGLAMKADKRSLKLIEARRLAAETKALKELKTHQAIAARLAKVELTATALVGEENRMFGAITAANIADLLAEQGIPIDRRTIELEEPIKALGVYNVSIRLHTDVSARVKVKVVAEEKKVE